MRYTLSIAVLNNLEMTRQCLSCLEKTTTGEWELIVSDNGSSDETPRFLRDYQATNPRCRVITYPTNTGFGHPHNQAMKIARGEYFVVLNNDIFIHEKGWNDKLARHFADPDVALVGFAGNHSGITEELIGIKNPPADEYVEASCLMIPRSLALRHGLFDPEYELAYFEDTDLSLRYRQKGFTFRLVECDYHHVNNATAVTLDQTILRRAWALNRETFQIRWGGYLRKRAFSSRILISAVAPLELLIQSTPVIHTLITRMHPVECHLVTNHPDLFRGWPLDRIDTPDETDPEDGYDRVIRFAYDQLLPDHPIPLSLSFQARVRIDSLRPLLYPDPVDPPSIIPRDAEWILVEQSVIDRVSPFLGGIDTVIARPIDDQQVQLSRDGRHESVDLLRIPSILTGCQGVIAPPGTLARIVSSNSTPLLLLLDPSHDPWRLGFDPESTLYALTPWDDTKLEQLVTSLRSSSPPQTTSLLQREILHIIYREVNIRSYHQSTDNHGELMAKYQAVQQELLLARQETASLRESLSWRITEPLRRLHRFITRGG